MACELPGAHRPRAFGATRLFVLGLWALSVLFVAPLGCDGCDEEFAIIDPWMQIAPDPIAFGLVPVTQERVLSVDVTNQANAPLSLTAIALTPDTDPAFSLVGERPTVVGPGATATLQLRVRARVVGVVTGTLHVEADSERTPVLDVPITAEGIDQGLPALVVDPETVDFARVGPRDVVRETIALKNEGVRDLIIDSTVLETEDGDTSIRLTSPVPPGWSIAPGQEVTVDVLFAPEDTAVHTATLRIASNDPDGEVTVPVRGQGSACPTAAITALDSLDELEPFDTVRFSGADSAAASEGAAIDTYTWQLTQRPQGSTAVMDAAGGDRAQLTCDLAGDYEVALSVTDTDGVRACEEATLRLRCVPTDDLHVQLVWDHASADMDIHFLRAGGEVFTHEGDTYFSNRTPMWFEEAPESNPRLDVDDDRGYGPENINVQNPLPGSTWQVWVHYWNAQTAGDVFAAATLRVYARGQLVGEVFQSFDSDQRMWRAVEIAWPMDDVSPPTITQLGVVEPFVRPF